MLRSLVIDGERGAMSLLNTLRNYVLTSIISSVPYNLKDSQSGILVIRRDVLKDIMPESDGMEFSEEIKIKAYLCKKRIYGFPAPYRRRAWRPKLRKFHDGLRNLLYIFLIFLRLRA